MKRIARILSVLTLTASALVVAPQIASAGTGACAFERLCVWEDINFNGDGYEASVAVKNWSAIVGTSGWAVSNDDSSWRSVWTVPVKIFRDDNYLGGAYLCLLPNYQLSARTADDDNGQSHKWTGGSTC